MALQINEVRQGIQATNLNFSYPDGTRVLDNVSFSVVPGSRTLLAGATGSGKSTLLRCLKPELIPHGSFSGEVTIDGHKTRELNAQLSAGRIGFVMQDPRQQIVMDTVKAELAFGLENLGVPPALIQRRVAEIANYFGINSWVERETTQLSGGETQVVNLAAIIAMQPRTLLLDEPTSMLDPIASRDFINLLIRINDELGITILMVEHHQEDLLSVANQVLYLDGRTIAFDGRPQEFARWLHTTGNANRRALPVAAQLCLNQPRHENSVGEEVPLDVREGRWWLWQQRKEAERLLQSAALSIRQQDEERRQLLQAASAVIKEEALAQHDGEAKVPLLHRTDSKTIEGRAVEGRTVEGKTMKRPAVVLKAQHVWFRYRKDSPYILKDLSLEVKKGSIMGIVGANASGKSTLLSLFAGAAKPQHGKVLQAQGVQFGVLPQDPTSLFLLDTIIEDLMDHANDFGYDKQDALALLARMGLENMKDRHPFDLSGGEQQKLSLVKLLLSNPDVLLLDEPTKGFDSQALDDLHDIIKEESRKGKTIVMVSHNLEFVAAAADECVMLFDGEPVGRADTEEFFADNLFYTTVLRRITQGIVEGAPSVLSRHTALREREAVRA